MNPTARPALPPPATADPLLEWRREFPTVEATLHFASHTLGAMPRGVTDALTRYAQTWTLRGIRAVCHLARAGHLIRRLGPLVVEGVRVAVDRVSRTAYGATDATEPASEAHQSPKPEKSGP